MFNLFNNPSFIIYFLSKIGLVNKAAKLDRKKFDLICYICGNAIFVCDDCSECTWLEINSRSSDGLFDSLDLNIDNDF